MLVFGENGSPVPLGQKLSGGDEADVYNVSDARQLAAKTYRNPSRYREAKLRAMISNPPQNQGLDEGHICWPRSLLFNQAGNCAGFLMDRAELAGHVPVFKLYKSPTVTWKYLIQAAIHISAVTEAIQARGHAFGDINESNILLAETPHVTLVGCDSIQVRDPAKGTVFRPINRRPEFTPPELQGYEAGKIDRLACHDNFGLGVLVFLLLMEGVHPYSGLWKQRSDPPALEERIRNGICPYAGNPDIDCLPTAPPYSLLPPDISELFVRCFGEGHADPSRRPSAGEWKAALTGLEKALVECPAAKSHFYSNHLQSCPWCEREIPAGEYRDSTGKDLRVIEHPSLRRRGLVRHAAVVLLFVILIFVGWNFLRAPARQLWSAFRSSSIMQPAESLTLSPMLMCTGIDSKGIPTGVSDTYAIEDVQETGVMAFLTYAGAVPGRTTFQMRWTIEGKTYQSPLSTFEREMDSIQLNLGKELPPGSHQIEFLVNGKVQRSASMTIEGSHDEPAQAVAAVPAQRRKRAARMEEAHSHLIPYTSAPATQAAKSEASNALTLSESSPLPDEAGEEPVSRPAASHPEMISYSVQHRHNLGGCSGEIKLTPQSIEFISDEHEFKFDVGNVLLVRNGIQDPNGKAWRFSHEWTDLENVLSRWKRGELFRKQ